MTHRELPTVSAMFARFAYDAGGTEEGRYRFQRLVQDLVAANRPSVSEVASATGSDWGIDTYVGRLNEEVVVWQSKFFQSWDGEPQRGQVRASLNELVKKAAEEGFSVSQWTLCVACILPPGEQKWFDGWAARQSSKQGFPIAMWHGGELRRQLQLADNERLREFYFPTSQPEVLSIPEVAGLDDGSVYVDALFVKQLEAAGHLETDAAKGFYFAAEALARDVLARNVQEEVAALREVELEAHGEWESQFNEATPRADTLGRMPGLISSVTQSVGALPSPVGFPLRTAHKRGLMHRLVELARAGWVTDWRTRARIHNGRVEGRVSPEAEGDSRE